MITKKNPRKIQRCGDRWMREAMLNSTFDDNQADPMEQVA
jgi:hypothetical protein